MTGATSQPSANVWNAMPANDWIVLERDGDRGTMIARSIANVDRARLTADVFCTNGTGIMCPGIDGWQLAEFSVFSRAGPTCKP